MEDDGRRNYHLIKSNPHALCYYYRRRGIPHSKSKKTIDPSKQSRQPGQMDQSMKGTKNKERRARGRPGGSAGTWSWCRRGTRAARGRRRWRRPWAWAGRLGAIKLDQCPLKRVPKMSPLGAIKLDTSLNRSSQYTSHKMF